MAAAPVQYQRLNDVQRTHAYTTLTEVEQAVVNLLFIFYEKSHYFTVEEDVRIADSLHTNISTALDTLYYTGGPAPAAGNDFMATLNKLIAFENDSFFKNSMSDQFYLIAMDAIRTLFNNQRSLPVLLPNAVLPFNGPNPWMAQEQRLLNSVSQLAYDVADAVDDAKRGSIILDPRKLAGYIKVMNRELRSSIWKQLQQHAAHDPQSQAEYQHSRGIIAQGVVDAKAMQNAQKRPRLSRSVKGSTKGGKQSSKRRTMRRQQYKRRGRRTIHRR